MPAWRQSKSYLYKSYKPTKFSLSYVMDKADKTGILFKAELQRNSGQLHKTV